MSSINITTISMRRKFKNADEAYNYFLNEIRINGVYVYKPRVGLKNDCKF